MKFKINLKFNIKIHNQYKNMIFTGFRDTDLEKKKKKKAVEEEPKNPQISSFPHHADGFELTIRANGDQAATFGMSDHSQRNLFSFAPQSNTHTL